jgi:hypothetical protein
MQHQHPNQQTSNAVDFDLGFDLCFEIDLGVRFTISAPAQKKRKAIRHESQIDPSRTTRTREHQTSQSEKRNVLRLPHALLRQSQTAGTPS